MRNRIVRLVGIANRIALPTPWAAAEGKADVFED
jgi:hypothetical protein